MLIPAQKQTSQPIPDEVPPVDSRVADALDESDPRLAHVKEYVPIYLPTGDELPEYAKGHEPIHVCDASGVKIVSKMVTDFIAGSDYENLLYTVNKLEEVMSKECPQLEKDDPTVYQAQQKNMAQAKWSLLRRLPIQAIEDLFLYHFEYFFDYDWEDILDFLKTRLLGVPAPAERDNIKQQIKSLIAQSQAQIGKIKISIGDQVLEPTVQNWLRDWRDFLKDKKESSLNIIEYLNSSPNVQQLPNETRDQVNNVLKFLLALNQSSMTQEGTEQKLLVADPFTGKYKFFNRGQLSDTDLPVPEESLKRVRAEYGLDENGRRLSIADKVRAYAVSSAPIEPIRTSSAAANAATGGLSTRTSSGEKSTTYAAPNVVVDAAKQVTPPTPPLIDKQSATKGRKGRLKKEREQKNDDDFEPPSPPPPSRPPFSPPPLPPQPQSPPPVLTPPQASVVPPLPVPTPQSPPAVPDLQQVKNMNVPVPEINQQEASSVFGKTISRLRTGSQPTPNISQQKVDYAEVAQRILGEYKFLFSSLGIEKRFLSVLISYLHGVRDKMEAREALSRPEEEGGVNLAVEEIDKLLTTADEYLAEAQRRPERSRRQAGMNANQPSRPTMKMVLKKIQQQKKKKETEVEQPHEQSGEVEDIFANVNPIFEMNEAAVEAQSTSGKEFTGGLGSKNIPSGRITQKQKEVITDIAPPAAAIGTQPKVMGPIDELRNMTATEFRRLSGDPAAAAQHIIEKIQLLEEESITKKAEGIAAWQSSPLNQLYLSIGNRSLEKTVTVEEAIKQMQEAGEQTLSANEFQAIADTNRQLRY